jgi:3-oxo-5-alpha-steroid 4-dehydrogenase 1
MERNIHSILLLVGFGMAAAVFAALFFVSAPYGRHTRKGWGAMIANFRGWILMESPSAVLFAVYFVIGTVPRNLPILLFLGMWEAHYIHRAFIYPLTIRDGRKKMPVAVMLMGLGFNLGNSYVNGRYLFTFSGGYPDNWVLDPRFLGGAFLFLAGFIINRWADTMLRSLRRPGETGYKIPYGGLFRWISCPNYLGEILEWSGWALATWSLPGLAFAVWTFANLAPRARANHAWYHEKFREYPPERKALIPWVW